MYLELNRKEKYFVLCVKHLYDWGRFHAVFPYYMYDCLPYKYTNDKFIYEILIRKRCSCIVFIYIEEYV